MRKNKVVTYLIVAIVLFISSIAVSMWQFSSQSERADIRKNGQPTTAFVVDRKHIQYNSPKGTVTVRPLVVPTKGTLKKYDLVKIFYDKNNYKKVVLDQNESAFDITIWIVAIKLFIASLIFYYFAYRNKKSSKKAI
ncbi:MAG: hypothetical protein U0R17_00580 [Acidimicrobiia bacterium]